MLSHGRSPTLREIGEEFAFSHSAAHCVVASLVSKGYLEKGENELRSLAFPLEERKERENVPVPFFSSEPTLQEVEENSTAETIFAVRALADRNIFAFRVASESMKNAGILPGDIALMERNVPKAENDDIILPSFTDDNRPLELRRFHPAGSEYVELWPENDTMGIIKVTRQNLCIAGRLIGIQRDYKGRKL